MSDCACSGSGMLYNVFVMCIAIVCMLSASVPCLQLAANNLTLTVRIYLHSQDTNYSRAKKQSAFTSQAKGFAWRFKEENQTDSPITKIHDGRSFFRSKASLIDCDGTPMRLERCARCVEARSA
jgi:hypothetical protein